jgi:hypothetical protein
MQKGIDMKHAKGLDGLSLLENATEFHDLTVVRMGIRDMKEKDQSFEEVVENRLRWDMDKMRNAQTTAGKKLYNAIRQIKNFSV